MMMDNDNLVFLVDLNELEDDALIPVSMDFTVNHGPHVWVAGSQPKVGDSVRLHYDEDDTLFWGVVTENLSDRDLIVRIDWDTCAPVINREWSMKDYHGLSTESPAIVDSSEALIDG